MSDEVRDVHIKQLQDRPSNLGIQRLEQGRDEVRQCINTPIGGCAGIGLVQQRLHVISQKLGMIGNSIEDMRKEPLGLHPERQLDAVSIRSDDEPTLSSRLVGRCVSK